MSSHQSPRQNYPEFVENFGRGKNPETAAKLAVGGDFEAVGIIEREALRYYGLSETGYLIDVGCGSGRLAIPLARDFHGRYLGTDVVPSFIEFAANAVSRPDWRFELVDSIVIPEVDNSADMVCFFSVFTHLLHEQTYLYLEEARRVLKPGGKVVFSFLEFPVDWHWTIFMTTVEDIRTGRPSHLNMFVDRYALEVFASHLGLRIDEFRDALERFVPLPYPVTHDNGVRMEDFASVGQSVCVMSKAQIGPTFRGEVDQKPDRHFAAFRVVGGVLDLTTAKTTQTAYNASQGVVIGFGYRSRMISSTSSSVACRGRAAFTISAGKHHSGTALAGTLLSILGLIVLVALLVDPIPLLRRKIAAA